MIGSPAPGEVKAKHPFQFVEAAVYRGLDSNTLCLVEKTGFEKAKVDLKEVERKLAPARFPAPRFIETPPDAHDISGVEERRNEHE